MLSAEKLGIIVLATIISGCVTTDGAGCATKANMSFSKSQMGSYCTLTASFINESEFALTPYVSLTVYDGNDNTIGSYSVRFDEILPGKRQSDKFVQHISNTQCPLIKKIVVNKAFHAPNYSYSGTRICGAADAYRFK